MRLPRLPSLERGFDGLPVVSDLERRLSLGLTVVAAVWFGLAAAWEMFGPVLAGHYASSASVGIIAENMLRWGILGPVWEYSAGPPKPSAYYCHHPWGIFWTTAALMKILGRHDVLCRLAPVLLSIATPPLLFALGRAIWRPAAGAVAAAAFAVLPISLAFANFNALEVPVIAWSLLGLWGFVRHTQTHKRRHLAASLVGFVLALHADWPAYVLVAGLLSFGLVRGFVLRKRPFGPVHVRSYAQWWVWLAALSVATGVLYLGLFHHAGKLGELLRSANMRSAGSGLPWSEAIEARAYWIELSFTPIALVLGKVAAVVCVLRLIVLRREHEILPLAVLGMAAFQYLVFKQGADVHIYWPHYFAPFFALGMGALTATVIAVGDRLRARLRRKPSSSASPLLAPRLTAATMGVCVLLLLLVLRDGVPALAYARATGGRFDEKGLLIHSDGAKTAFLRWLAPELPAKATVGMHVGMKNTWAQMWALGGRVVRDRRPVPKPGRGEHAYVADTRFMYEPLQAELAGQHHVVAVGPFWRVIRGQQAAPLDAYRFVEREPTFFEWFLLSGTEPQRSIEADPFATWQLRTHFEQPVELPEIEPDSLAQRLVAHNIALDQGDPEGAKRWLAEIRGELRALDARFDDGSELVGARYDSGARPVLWLVLRAGGPTEQDVQLHVRSKVIARASWSTTMADPKSREVGVPLGLSPQRWREGFLYGHPVAIRKRPGIERFEALFKIRKRERGKRAAAPQLVDGRKAIEVLRLQ